MKFSIVVPTRNRAAMLPCALRSALDQSFDDYEIVVSDNHSSDATAKVLDTFSDPRLRTYRTDRALSMADHWEWALGKARADWVLILCDDDALLPDTLEQLLRIVESQPAVEAVQYGKVEYLYADGRRNGGNSLHLFEPVLRSLEVRDSAKQLRTVYRRLSGDMPKLLNAAVRRSVLDRIRQQHGRVFHPWAPDYSAGLLILAATRRYARADWPLFVWGNNRYSYGAGSKDSPAHMMEFFREFDEFDGIFPHSPYPRLMTIWNGLYDTLERTRIALGNEYRHLRIKPVNFCEWLLADIDRYIAAGHGEYEKYRDQVRKDLRHPRHWPYRAARWLWRERKDVLRRSSPGKPDAGPRIVCGDDAPEGGFKDIYEASQAFPRIARFADGNWPSPNEPCR